MKNVTLYHNPRCSKSRQTLQLLRENNIEPMIVEYLEKPPSKVALKRIIQQLNLTPRQLMRKNESVFKALNLADKSLSDEKLIAAMVENPILIERPIVVSGDKAVIGRPPEKVMGML